MAIFTNFATLSYNGGQTDSNIVTGEIIEAITATKTAVVDTYTLGEDVTYVISLINTSEIDFTGLVVTDDLGAFEVGTDTVYPLQYKEGSIRYYVNGVLEAAPQTQSGPPLVVSGINIPAGGNVILVYETDVTNFAPPVEDGTITNTVTVTGGGISTPVTATETVTVSDELNLSISKALSPAQVSENGQLTYTFVIENRGNIDAVATDDIVVTDVFNPILSDITVTLNGEVLTENVDYTYNEATGEFATVAGRITVPAATFTQNEDGSFTVTPGTATLVVSGTV